MHIPEDEAERRRLNERGREILRRKNGAVRPHREDGYVNLLNKYGTKQDNSEAYKFEREPVIPDMQLTGLYEGNGLFSKIIDTPAEEALKHGFDLNLKSNEMNAFVDEVLDDLEWDEKATIAIKWARLYGGALIVMLIDDGRGLEEPVDWEHIRSIDELRVYERSIVQPDYASLYQQDYGGKGVGNRVSKFGQPEYYYVSSIYGSFKVHESRCLVFRNGVLPEQTSNATYLFWGMPEYVRIRRALRETVTAHTDSVKLLERSVQAIYSMKGLASLLTTDDGENQVLKRLQLVDTSRGLLNSIAIDSEGEQYDFKTFQFSGVKDVIDATCNMLSALTNIPQTILFGRSPAGMNATGDSDFESYYNFVEKIQRLMLKRNLRTLLDVVFRAGIASGDVAEEPDYKLEFKPLWSLSDTEQATVDQTKAQTALVKAQTAQAYVDMQALDPTEVRRRLASDEEFDVEDIISEDDEDDLLQSLLGTEPSALSDVEAARKNLEQGQTPGGAEQSVLAESHKDAANAENWVTINGTHVLIDENGVAQSGGKLKGKEFKGAKSQKSSEASKTSPTEPPSAKNSPDAVFAKTGYKPSYTQNEQWAMQTQEAAASYLSEKCGYGYDQCMGLIGSGKAIDEAKNNINKRYVDVAERYENASDSQKRVMDLSTEDLARDQAEAWALNIDPSLNLSSGWQRFVALHDLNDKPQILDDNEFERVSNQSEFGKLYRGVRDGFNVSASDIIRDTMYGDKTYIGQGRPDGFYTSTQKETAVDYGHGNYMTLCLSPKAKAIDEQELNRLASTEYLGIAPEVVAYSLGYNAVVRRNAPDGAWVDNGSGKKQEDDHIIFLTREAMCFPESTSPRADAADTDRGVGVLVVQDGRFLCGTRLKGGSVGGPGGHIEAGESPEDAAIRETQEEFGITPKDLMPVAFLSDLKPPYCPSHVFLCTDFDGSIRCADGEMTSPGFITAEKVAELSTQNPERLFPPFAQSITALLDVLSSNPGLTSEVQNAKMKDRMDFNEADHPRDENGQFAESEGSSSGSTESGPAVSPEGENVPCTGFASPARLEDHATRHGLAEMDFATKEEYQQKGIDFLKQPCGGDVIGYARPDGVVVRFNTKTTEYATGVPGGPLKTYMKAKCNRKTGEARPEVAMKYYEFNREKDLKEEDDEQGS
jgi:phage-related protein (TIGR01555 family)